MKCEDTYDALLARREGTLDEHEARQLAQHLESCEECHAAERAANALRDVRAEPPATPPAGLLDRVVQRSKLAEGDTVVRSRFWLGAVSGAAIAASLTVAIMSSGLLDNAASPVGQPAGFEVALGEPRNISIAIEMPHDLPNAEISVALVGGIELEGYAGRRELTWTTDLEAGVNKLTLPLVAVDRQGGRLLVRVGHGNKERRFSMDVNLES